MAFDQTTITAVRSTVANGQLELSWDSTSPAGTGFQVYVRGVRAWSGVARRCVLPAPAEGRARVAIGAVGPGELGVDFSGSLDPLPADRATLAWTGGGYLDPAGADDVAGFRVYGSAVAGGPVDYSAPLAELAAYEDGVVQDGWGLGGFGQGGWGKAATSYAWTSPPLRRGVWSFAVRSFDAIGQESPTSSGSVAIGGPPGPPARVPAGRRLDLSYDPSTRVATLSWLPSEG